MLVKPLRPPRSVPNGVTFVDLLIFLSVLLVACSMGIQTLTGVQRAGEDLKRRRDVVSLNASLANYLGSGGSVSAGTSGETVLAKLKTAAAEKKPGTFAGLRGSFVDPRLKGSGAELHAGDARIVWDANRARFAIATQGAGWSALYHDSTEAAADHGSEVRRALHSFASESRWVWDYADSGTGRRGPERVATANPGVLPASLPEDPYPLAPPVISPRTGVFSHRDFPLALTIANPNPPGASDTVYQVNNGDWAVWPGGQSSLPKALTTTVTALCQAREMSIATDSEPVTESYVCYFMRGIAGGAFFDPAGEKRLLYSLTAGGTALSWGKIESAGQASSSIAFIPGAVFEAGEGDSVELGRLRYTNGLTRAGTNVRTATLRMELTLSIPAGITLSVNLPVRMMNTIHYPGTAASEHTDYVWIPQTLMVSQPLTILDRRFALSIRAEALPATVDGADLKLPVKEGENAEITLFASLSALE